MQDNPGAYSIRLLEEKDVPLLVELEQLVFPKAWGEESYLRWLHQGIRQPAAMEPFLPSNAVFAAWHTSDILYGYISVAYYKQAAEMEILNIAVRPEHRGKGIGTCLLQHALKAGASAAIERAVLEVRTGNHPAIALYESAGFKKAGVRKNYYADTGEDALVLLHELSRT